MIASVGELPFDEHPLRELLHVAVDRATPDGEYAGFGWARARTLWLTSPGAPSRLVSDALLLAMHGPDDGEPLGDDVELFFELPEEPPVTVLASVFLAHWLPRLPRDVSCIVLALCNPHAASLSPPPTDVPLHFAQGDVESWISRDDGRIELRAPRWSQTGGSS